MADQLPRKKPFVIEPSAEFEKLLSQVVGSESVKHVERLIKTPNSETKLNYEIQVDPTTGQQKVVESFVTTKKECALCGGYFAQTFICADCRAQICANDMRYLNGTYVNKALCKICGKNYDLLSAKS